MVKTVMFQLSALFCIFNKNMSVYIQLSVLFCICFASSFGELQRFEHPVKGNGSLSFLVVGDWGRKGLNNQSEVAFQMGRIGEKLDIDFVISTGDNFYENGLEGVNDIAFKQSFTDAYIAKSLQKQWYSVLGNHDYRGDVLAQLNPILRKIDKRWLCLRSFIVNAEFADFFFVDTSPFVDMYLDDEHTYDWRGIIPRETYIVNLLKDLESALSESTANWKIVVGHHAIRSISHHGDTQELVDQLLPMLKDNNVDFYMNGHDHCLEHMSCSNSRIQYFTSGAGSKAWRGQIKEHNECDANFFYDGQGFMSVELTSSDGKITFYDMFGNNRHQFSASKPLVSSM